MKVPLLDLQAQYKSIKVEIDQAVLRVLESQKGILGPEVAELEKQVAAYCHSNHAIAVASGTDALLLSLMALGTGSNDGVITTPFTFFATAGSISRLGARPFFVDIEPDTFNIDPKAVSNFLKTECSREKEGVIHKPTRRIIKAILPVHLYGQCADMVAIGEISREWGLRIIEDACQSIGSCLDNRPSGTMGDFGALSFFPSKNLGGLGDGGMVLAQDSELAHKVKVLRVHGSEPKYYHKVVGINSRLDTLQAAILTIKLKHLNQWTKTRQKNAEIYDNAFHGINEITTPQRYPRSTHVFNQYCIRVENRDELRHYLTERGIGTEVYYPLPLHLQECFQDLGYAKGDFPHSEKAAGKILALPIYPELTSDQIEYVIGAVMSFIRQTPASVPL
ncbi:MAG: DegT/DnrJ/EryC1/StrS family aminotransferase [Elusimicrobia bacterium]|nr:DegT/DnrJ/EryC1/StrS family aminotransferase [Candidatus Obscuribacterium magneticum]